MALPFPINANQTDAKSPIDQQLMDAIRLNQEFLDSQLGGGSAGGVLNFRVNGFLTRIKALLDIGAGKKLDGGIVSAAVSFTKASLYLEKGGTSGALEVDVFRHKEVQHGIESIEALLSENIISFGVLGSPLTTQAVTREASDISTQQINRVQPTLNIESIQALENDKMLITFSGTAPISGDYKTGEQIIVAGANASNNGAFPIDAINIDGLPSILVTNASAVSDLTGGTVELDLFEYVFNASVDPDFVAGETVQFIGHSDADNNGFKLIERTNDGGNNIIAYAPNGSTQGSVAGSARCLRLRYTVAEAVDPENYVVGELGDFNSHSSGNNNGLYKIVAINSDSGNNITILNDVNGGDTQAGAGGNVNTRRQVVGLNTDPDGILEVADKIIIEGRSVTAQDGTYEIKLLKKFGLNNVVIYLGSTDNSTGTSGTVVSEKKQVNFREDFSAFYVANTSKAMFENLGLGTQTFEKEVVEVNRGGFTNYNIVVLSEENIVQASSSGRVSREVRTIFIQRPRIEYTEDISRDLQVDTNATFTVGGVEADTILTLEVLEVPEGLPSTLVLSLS